MKYPRYPSRQLRVRSTAPTKKAQAPARERLQHNFRAALPVNYFGLQLHDSFSRTLPVHQDPPAKKPRLSIEDEAAG